VCGWEGKWVGVCACVCVRVCVCVCVYSCASLHKALQNLPNSPVSLFFFLQIGPGSKWTQGMHMLHVTFDVMYYICDVICMSGEQPSLNTPPDM